MPETRQPTSPPAHLLEDTPRGAGRLPHGFQMDSHAHREGQLVYAATGALATTTERGTWLAPANRVTWTPPGFPHAHRIYGETDVRLLAIPVVLCRELPARPGVFAVSPVLREVLLALTDRPETRPGAYDRLRAVAVDELIEAPDRSLHLPEPDDDRLRAVTDLLHADPAHSATLAELGREVGAGERTLSRLFHTELGMSFHRWRTVLRIHHGLIHLTNGLSVTETATACGWSNPTSFIEAFTEIVGQTPGRYQTDLRSPSAADPRPASRSRPDRRTRAR
ncbi:helix-turn-helix domain-containing protein [Catenuloplanes japonicus]|uniref:helix-turn-helix domain-containing protein n=1 Tax=Catenuloplanes japonicus TaxID=33876 RepID=UPI000A11629F|nr:helix-turn-helix transcriptional regulator [Catenuloplanes japonicus]